MGSMYAIWYFRRFLRRHTPAKWAADFEGVVNDLL
jgi:hypothetical protein